MSALHVREQLSRQLNELPDHIVNEIADFTAFILARHQIPMPYLEWTEAQWKALSLSQFFRDADDDVAYTINDAEEVYTR
jgi:hypothetical protein